MNNKKIFVSLLLVFLIALSVGSVSAEDADDIVAADEADDVVAVDADIEVLEANTFTPDTQDAAGIQNAINSATTGDTVDLSKYASYNIGNTTLNVQGKDNLVIKGNGTTTLVGTGGTGSGNSAAGAFFIVSNSKGVTFQGINFIDEHPDNNIAYAGSVNGWGINFQGQGAAQGVVDNCSFHNFNQAIIIKSCNNVTVQNSKFTGGIATLLINDPTVNKEQGSKVISVGGSFYTTIVNNTFDGPVLDAISIAQASGDARIYNNTFINNAYSIFFGGASTDGTFICGNTFINCGSYKDEERDYTGFPVISIEKASSGVFLDGNTFYVGNDNMLIKSEQGNTAHGYPSTLGNINVTNNVVEKYSDDVITSSVTLYHILCRSGNLNPYADITVTGNVLVAGVKPLVVWSNDWGTEDKNNNTDIVIPAADPVQTVIVFSEIAKDGTVTAVLKDINGNPLAGYEVVYTIAGNNTTAETDENGAITIASANGEEISIAFAGITSGTTKYAESDATITVPSASLIPTKIEAVSLVTRSANDYNAGERGELLGGRLVDADGNPIANQLCFISVNGPIYNATTDENGNFGIQVNLAVANTYTYALTFLGNDQYAASLNGTKLVLTAKKTTITASKTTYKASAKTKTLTATLKTTNKYLSKGKKITFTVNGKTYTAKTDAKGVAKVKVSLTKKGTYNVAIKFAGDKTYAASSKTVKLVLK